MSFLGDQVGGIEDIFRDSGGKILIQFGNDVVVDSAVHVEV